MAGMARVAGERRKSVESEWFWMVLGVIQRKLPNFADLKYLFCNELLSEMFDGCICQFTAGRFSFGTVWGFRASSNEDLESA